MSKNDKPNRSIAFMFNVDDPVLTPDQAHHVAELVKEFAFEMTEKYIKGQREHGGNLWDLPIDALLNNAIDEAIDQVVYLLTLKRKIRANNPVKP